MASRTTASGSLVFHDPEEPTMFIRSARSVRSARTVLAALAVSALALPLTTALTIAPALASHGGDGEVRTHGGCDGPAVWKLKVKPDSGRIELEAEVDSNHSGQVWHWRIKHNGSVS